MTDEDDPRADLWGIDWDFLAVDSAGHVAVISSAGTGPIPEAVLAGREVVERTDSAIAALPKITRAVPDNPRRGGNTSVWYSSSERGLYVYDWTLWNGPYERISAPAEPLDIGSLPEHVQEAAHLLQIPYLFAGASQLHLDYPPRDIGDGSRDHEPDGHDEAGSVNATDRASRFEIARGIRSLLSRLLPSRQGNRDGT